MAEQAIKQPRTTTRTRKNRGRDPTRTQATRVTASGHRETIRQWLAMNSTELDELYCNAEPGPIPQGDTRGTAILAGGFMPGAFAGLARILAWQGKVFDLFGPDYKSGVAINKVSPLGLPLIVARVYRGESWLDGKETIVIDYSTTSLVARPIRDEIRQIHPDLYLGKVWWGQHRILDFALEVPEPTPM